MSFVSLIGGNSAAAGTSAASAITGGTSAAKSDFDAILDKLKKLGSETPAERARDSVLKKHKMTEEDYQKMPVSERTAIDQEIAAAVKMALDQQAKAQKTQRIA